MAHFGTKSELVITDYTSQTCSDFVGSKLMSLRTHRTSQYGSLTVLDFESKLHSCENILMGV